MYRCKTLAKLLIWHKDGASTDGLIQSVPNSQSWKYITGKWLDFAVEARNI